VTRRGLIGIGLARRIGARRPAPIGLASLAVLALAGSQLAGTGFAAGANGPTRYTLANRCWALVPVGSASVATAGDGYRVNGRRGAARLYLKPTRLGAYLVYDQGGLLMTKQGGKAVGRVAHPSKRGVWTPKRSRHRSFKIVSSDHGDPLGLSRRGELRLVPPADAARFRFRRTDGCRRYPEAKANAAGKSFKGTTSNGTVKGFVDAHLHITADMRAGGRVLDGRSFAPLGVTRALGGDARNHGPDGSLDVTGNLLRSGTPFGTHDVHGWPTFAGWPVHDTITHQQTYYMWLKRAWKAGERLVVAQTVEDAPLCKLEPRRAHSCNETETIKLEIKRLKKLERYVAAQSGGPGRGWFQIVRSPAEAQRVIAQGKLAVIIGIESSDLFNCSEFMDKPKCTKADVDRGIEQYKNLGVRSMFIAHWVDNAFAGAALEGGARGSFIGILEALQTGEYFTTGPCPEKGQGEEVTTLGLPILKFLSQFFPDAKEILGIPIPDYPAGKQCNAKGLTGLGHYLVRRMMANHMLIEVDHMSERARLAVLKMAEAHDYPLVSSHTDTGGFWTRSDLQRLYAVGGFATARLDDPTRLADSILKLRREKSPGHYFGVGLGTDTGGFAELPGPPSDAAQHPLSYPFHSYMGDVKFARERSGERTYDLNIDGVAHYGLVPDLLADMQTQPRGELAMRLLFRSAQAYLDTWSAAYRHG
jgi:microsomal dipeptidase-like Zn-dependent dipeptidase